MFQYSHSLKQKKERANSVNKNMKLLLETKQRPLLGVEENNGDQIQKDTKPQQFGYMIETNKSSKKVIPTPRKQPKIQQTEKTIFRRRSCYCEECGGRGKLQVKFQDLKVKKIAPKIIYAVRNLITETQRQKQKKPLINKSHKSIKSCQLLKGLSVDKSLTRTFISNQSLPSLKSPTRYNFDRNMRKITRIIDDTKMNFPQLVKRVSKSAGDLDDPPKEKSPQQVPEIRIFSANKLDNKETLEIHLNQRESFLNFDSKEINQRIFKQINFDF